MHAGQKQLFSNVFASGVAYAVSVCIGFILPRIIFDSVGQFQLGLWDVCWSFIAYITHTGLGFGPAIAHFIARHEHGDMETLQPNLIATGFYCQLAFSLLVASLFLFLIGVVAMLSTTLSSADLDLLWTVGICTALTLLTLLIGESGQGFLSGHHHLKISEYINTVHDLMLALCMIGVLAIGHGIVGLAVVTLALRIAAETARLTVAVVLLNGSTSIQASLSKPLWCTAKQLIRYATKTSASVAQDLFVVQGVRLGLFISAGPAVLAIFSRYATITRQINRLIDRLSQPIPALVSGLDAVGEHALVREVYVNSARNSVLASLPLLCVFAVFGDQIVLIWMGKEFISADLAWILCGGAIFHAHYMISSRVLSGLNQHGRLTLACLSLSAFMLLVLMAEFFPDTMGEAATGVLVILVFGVHLPYVLVTAKKLQLHYISWVRIYGVPGTLNLLFLSMLIIAEYFIAHDRPIISSSIILAAFIGLGLSYWRFALTPELRATLSGKFTRPLRKFDTGR